jgi:hypothetical protein
MPWTDAFSSVPNTISPKVTFGAAEFTLYAKSADCREGNVAKLKFGSIVFRTPSGFPGVEATKESEVSLSISIVGWDTEKAKVELKAAQIDGAVEFFLVKFDQQLGDSFKVDNLGIKVGYKISGGVEIDKWIAKGALKKGGSAARYASRFVSTVGAIETAFILGGVVVVVTAGMSMAEATELAEARKSLEPKIQAALDQYMIGVQGGSGGAGAAEGAKDRATFIANMKSYLASQDPPVEATDEELRDAANEAIQERLDAIRSSAYPKVAQATKDYLWNSWAQTRGKSLLTSVPERRAMFSSIYGRGAVGAPGYVKWFPND